MSSELKVGEKEQVAVVIPCLDEATTIGKVVSDFRRVLPDAEILVVDNRSDDGTAEEAAKHGARVVFEGRRGKGYALLTGFEAAAHADYVIMVDGDDTYPAERAPEMLAAARSGAEMVVGARMTQAAEGSFPTGHGFGNVAFVRLVRLLFGMRTRDLFSGYRVLSRHFLGQAPLVAYGFEVEAELSMQAMVRGFPVKEIDVEYRARPERSHSKLRTVRDGTRILLAIVAFFRDYRPLAFFGSLTLLLLCVSLICGGVVVAEFLRTGLVHRVPLALVATGTFILGALAAACGIVISAINRRAAEIATMIARAERTTVQAVDPAQLRARPRRES
ncbi:MAG: glycosyltransferase [Myxococcales bacterium]|nr:glycosyltransferase [Myxococcales bacterium]